jgi:putative MATE family efflux protein
VTGSAAPAIRPFLVTHRSVLRIALPMTLAYLSTPLVGLIATGVIGQLGNAAMIGGVALGAVIFDVIFVSFNFLRGATTGFTAQATGAGDPQEEQDMLLGGLAIAAVAGGAILLLQAPLAVGGLAALGAHGDIAEYGRAYYDARVWSAPFVFFNFVIYGWVLGRGEALTGLLLQLLLNGFGIALAVLLVLGLGWGVAGAGWAAVAAEAIAAAAGGMILLARTDRRRWRLAETINPARLRRLLSVNGDMMIRSLALLGGLSFFTRQSAVMGVDILAANTILLRLYFFAVAFLDGLATAAEQLAGRAVGARFRPAFDRVVGLTTIWGFAFAVIVTLALFATGPWIIRHMTPIPEIRDLALAYLSWAAMVPLVGVVAFQMDGIFIGATWSREMRNMMLLSLVVYIATWAALTPFLGNHGLWIALLAFNGARSIAFRWQMRALVPRTFGPQ